MVLAPIQGYLGADVDMNRANEIRPVMKRIGTLAEKYHCAIILIGHMNKCSGGKSSYRGLGSIDFQAAARSVLVVGRVKDDEQVRVACHIKSCLCALPGARLPSADIPWETFPARLRVPAFPFPFPLHRQTR